MTQGTESKSPDESVHTVMVENQHEMLRYLTRRLGNRDEAADVLQNFYVKVLRRIGDVRDTEKLRGWMRRVLETTLIDYFRAQGKRRESETNYHDLKTAGFFGNNDEDVDFIVCACLYKLLPTLKPEYAHLLWRADLTGESRESIANALSISESNLRVRLHRARQALRQRLEETCRTCPIDGYLDCGCSYSDELRAKIEQNPPEL